MFIQSVGSALPEYCADNTTVLGAAKQWLRDEPSLLPLFERFLESSRTKLRYFAIPPNEIVTLSGAEQRARSFEELAPPLACAALDSALNKAQRKPTDIDALIWTSCSSPIIPSADTYLVERLGLRPDIIRIPSYQYGCAGGVIGLGLGHRLAASAQTVAVVSAEICSLVFQPTNCSTSHLVGAAIFGDGAAAALLTRDPTSPAVEILAHSSYLIPQTRHLMGYDIRDTGAHLRLERELPVVLVDYLPSRVESFLASHHLTRADVAWWLFHPGSSKILSSLEEQLAVRHQQCHWSRDVLTEVGNLSSATILFVLQRFIESGEPRPQDHVLIVGIGPGLTIELVLARVV